MRRLASGSADPTLLVAAPCGERRVAPDECQEQGVGRRFAGRSGGPAVAVVPRAVAGTIRVMQVRLQAGWRHWRHRSSDGIRCMSDGGREQSPGMPAFLELGSEHVCQ